MDETFTLSSPAFENDGIMPSKYTCDGDPTLSPPLSITGIPAGTKSLVLIMDDPDIPQVAKDARGTEAFDHWVLYNLPPVTTELPASDNGNVGAGEHGLNSTGKTAYTGPCPPPQYEPREHRYVFTVYALSDVLHFSEFPTKEQVLSTLKPYLISKATLIGRYAKK